MSYMCGIDEPPLLYWNPDIVRVMKAVAIYKKDVIFKKCTKDEINYLKWDDRKDIMLLSYSNQKNMFTELSEDLVRMIIQFI